MDEYYYPKFRLRFDAAGAIRHRDDSPNRSATLYATMRRFPAIRNGIRRHVIPDDTRIAYNLALQSTENLPSMLAVRGPLREEAHVVLNPGMFELCWKRAE